MSNLLGGDPLTTASRREGAEEEVASLWAEQPASASCGEPSNIVSEPGESWNVALMNVFHCMHVECMHAHVFESVCLCTCANVGQCGNTHVLTHRCVWTLSLDACVEV